MSDFVARWPSWYLVLVAYTAWIAISELRHHGRVSAALRETAAVTASPSERARVQGQRAGGWVRAASWLVAALLLLGGWNWARALVALRFLVSARRSVRDFAIAFAEGRKSSELAAAHEYVRGRVAPQAADYLVANCVALVTRGFPLAAILYAIAALPR